MWISSVHSVEDPQINTTDNLAPLPVFDNFCQHLRTIGNTYNVVHGYTSLTICCFGTVANILNLLVLTRREMVNSTNIILAGLAVADLLTTVEYVPFAIYMNFLPDPENLGKTRKTYLWAIYVLFHSNFSQVCHTIAIWLTVTVAAWRYLMISMPLECKSYCSIQRARYTLILAYIISPLLCVPIYLAFSIKPVISNETVIDPPNVAVILHNLKDNFTVETSSQENLKYIVHLSDLARTHKIIVTINFWVYSVVIKIIPCVLLTVVSLRLIRSLMKVKKRRELLLGLSPVLPPAPAAQSSGSRAGITAALALDPISIISITALPQTSQQMAAENSQTSAIVQDSGGIRKYNRCSAFSGEIHLTKRTTRMLLTVLILFLITEFPQGVLALFSDLMGDEFFQRCYIPMANLMDFLALFNAALNFLLYFATSVRFRNSFYKLGNLCCQRSSTEERGTKPEGLCCG